MMASPLAAGLFDKAIVESGALMSTTLEIAEHGDAPDKGPTTIGARQHVDDLLRALGEKTPQTNLSSDELAQKLRRMNGKKLLATVYQNRGNGVQIAEDGVVLPKMKLHEVFKRPGAYNDVPVISGTTRDETKFFQYRDPRLVDCPDIANCVAKNERLYDLFAEYSSAAWRASSVDSFLRNKAQSGETPVWAYRFDWDETGTSWQVGLQQTFRRFPCGRHGFSNDRI